MSKLTETEKRAVDYIANKPERLDEVRLRALMDEPSLTEEEVRALPEGARILVSWSYRDLPRGPYVFRRYSSVRAGAVGVAAVGFEVEHWGQPDWPEAYWDHMRALPHPHYTVWMYPDSKETS